MELISKHTHRRDHIPLLYLGFYVFGSCTGWCAVQINISTSMLCVYDMSLRACGKPALLP